MLQLPIPRWISIGCHKLHSLFIGCCFVLFFYICAGACFIFSHMIAHLPVWFGRCSNEPGFIFCLLIGQLLFVSW